jgi:hypothetical protein
LEVQIGQNFLPYPELARAFSQIEDVLHIPAYAVFPDIPGELEDSYTMGTLVPRNSLLGEQFHRFANNVAGVDEPTAKRRRFFNFG